MVGRTNAGKGVLPNALLGYRRALVDPAAGTTRDVLTAATAVDGWPVELADTAGSRAAASALPNSQGNSADISQPSSQPDSLPNSQPDSRPVSPPGALHERAAEPTDMQAWIAKIRSLRAAGRDVEADESLARFRVRYPAFVVSDDLAGVR